ncbi:MAG: amidohydrolase family protein [Planctomycetes bacterium]|nr:amidohydrolase family protein [Planctomycetota bacterium]
MDKKVILNARLIDGTGRPPIEPGVVVVGGPKIAAVGRAGEVALPAEAERIDAASHTVMPGLMDGHMHVTRMPAFLDANGHLAESLRAVGVLRRTLGWGTTTVANVGGCPENVLLRKAIEDGQVTRCSRLLVGAMVNATGGHVRGRSADGPWEVRKAVREMVAAGADFIKTAASGGFQWEHERLEQEDYTLEELTALVNESHAKGKRVAVHAHAQPGLNHAIQAGCDVIAHGALIDEDALQGIAAKGLHYMPTLYITSDKVISRPNLPAHMKARMQHAHPIHRAGVRRAVQLGLKLCAGTDGGPGDVMLELVELVQCRLSPLDAIRAATRNTADALGILDTVGTLETGKAADLLIVNGDPLADVARLCQRENVLLVMKDGRVEFAAEDWKRYFHPRD